MSKKEKHKEVCFQLGVDPATIPMIIDVSDALKLLKSKAKLPKFLDVENDLREYFQSDWSLIKITEAMNLQPDGKIWKPNYLDGTPKFEPSWFNIKADAKHPSGFGVSDSLCGVWPSGSTCGSRLAYKERIRLRYVLIQCNRLFERKILLK